jgi:hypothetical protein
MNTVGKIFGIKKPTGPSEAQLAAQTDATNRASEQRAEADKLAALSASIGSRRRQLDYSSKGTLGG